MDSQEISRLLLLSGKPELTKDEREEFGQLAQLAALELRAMRSLLTDLADAMKAARK